MAKIKRIIKTYHNLLVLLFYFLVAIIITWPLILHLNNYVLNINDGLLNTWMLNWTTHSISTGLKGILNYYHANIFFPYQYTFAFSDLHLPVGILVAPFILLTGEPLVGYNLAIILGLILNAFSTYLLMKRITNLVQISFLIGFVFSFSPLHLGFIVHQQVFHIWLPVFSLYFLLANRKILFSLFFLLSTLMYVLNFYILLFAAIIYAFIFHKFRTILSFLLISVGITIPFLLPYYFISHTFHYVRPLKDTIHFSLYLPELFNIASTSRLMNILPTFPTINAYFIGLSGSVLILWMLVSRSRKLLLLGKLKASWLFFLVLGIVSFVLALGPGLHVVRETVHVGPIPLVPLPYMLFYYLIPGFRGFRTPSRWVDIMFLSFMLAAGILLRKRISVKIIFCLALLTLLEIQFPFHYYRVPSVKQFPPEQIWLKDNYQGAPLIQLPIYRWDDPSPKPDPGRIHLSTTGVGEETLREYYSTIHWHPMYNGYSGFSPKEWEQNVRWLQQEFPSDLTLKYLKGIGLKLILVPRSWEKRMAQFSKLVRVIKVFPETSIYLLL